jgi:hypothetical protein
LLANLAAVEPIAESHYVLVLPWTPPGYYRLLVQGPAGAHLALLVVRLVVAGCHSPQQINSSGNDKICRIKKSRRIDAIDGAIVYISIKVKSTGFTGWVS